MTEAINRGDATGLEELARESSVSWIMTENIGRGRERSGWGRIKLDSSAVVAME